MYICGKDAVFEHAVGRVDIYGIVRVKEVGIGVVIEHCEHVLHAVHEVVPVEDCHGFVEITAVVARLREDGAVGAVFSVRAVVVIILVLCRVLKHGVVYGSAGDLDPRIYIGVYLLQRCEIDGQVNYRLLGRFRKLHAVLRL